MRNLSVHHDTGSPYLDQLSFENSHFRDGDLLSHLSRKERHYDADFLFLQPFALLQATIDYVDGPLWNKAFLKAVTPWSK